MALSETARLIASLELQDKFSPNVRKVESSLSRLEAGLGRTAKGVGQIGAGLGRVGLIAATAVGGGIIAATKLAGDFEAQLNTINTIVKLNEGDLRRLGEGIRTTFRETGQPLNDLTAAYYDLLSAGIKVEDAQGLLNTSVKLGIGGLATTEEAVNLLTTAVNAYGLSQSGATRAADIFAAAVRDGKVTVAEISASFADVAPLAAQFGIKLEEVGAAYAVLTGRGVLAAEVGTQFNRSLIEGLKPGPQLIKVLDGLGASFEDLIKQKGLVETLEDIRVEAAKQGIDFEDLFGRIEAYKFALATTGPNLAAFRREQEKMGAATGEVNAQFAERQQGLNFQLGKLKALAQDAGITIGNALLPKIVPLIEKLNDFIQKNQGKIEAFGQKLADAFGNFAERAQKADFTGLIDGLKLLATFGQKVVDIFLSLPSGVQAALVAGVAVNKLSGGLIGAGVGNVAGGIGGLLFDRFLARGSGPFNPMWVKNVGLPGTTGGGPPIIAGAGGKGGGLGGLLGAASRIFAGLFVADLASQLITNKSLFDNILSLAPGSPFTPDKQPLGPLDAKDGKPIPVEVVNQTGKSALAGDVLGTRALIADLKLARMEGILPGLKLPDTAVDAGGGVVNLPDTALRPLKDTATNTSRLPAILSRQEAAAQQIAARVNDARGAIGRGFSELGGVVRSSKNNLRVTVNVNSSIAISDTLRRITSARVATGTISEF